MIELKIRMDDITTEERIQAMRMLAENDCALTAQASAEIATDGDLCLFNPGSVEQLIFQLLIDSKSFEKAWEAVYGTEEATEPVSQAAQS